MGNKHFREQPLWPSIVARHPDIWMWTGDIVYHDRPNIGCARALFDFVNPFNQSTTRFHCHRIGYGPYQHFYDQNFLEQSQHDGYLQLTQNNKTEIIGVWDDHDFG